MIAVLEAKNINTPKVTKDARRQINKVFLEEKKNYVYRVEQREKHLILEVEVKIVFHYSNFLIY